MKINETKEQVVQKNKNNDSINLNHKSPSTIIDSTLFDLFISDVDEPQDTAG